MRPRALLLCLLAVAGAAAGIASCAKKPAGALAADPNPMDYGVKRWGENPELEVRVTNRSDRAVTFSDPTFDCTCFALAAPPAKSRLEAGESVRMRVVMRTQMKDPGRFHKTMIVKSDDPVAPRLDVPIVGDVVDYRTIKPKQVAFGAVPAAGPAREMLVEVRGGNGSTVTVRGAVPDDAQRVAVQVKPVEGGADLVVRTVPGAPKGRFSSQVRVLMDVGGEGREAHPYSDLVWVTGDVE